MVRIQTFVAIMVAVSYLLQLILLRNLISLFIQEFIIKLLSYPVTGASSSISLENVKHATLCGLSAAAIKSKLFADQEEREIQRLVATVINHQVSLHAVILLHAQFVVNWHC